MEQTRSTSLDEVVSVLVEVLGIEDRASGMDAATPLLGSLPELDSMAVLELVAALEARFDIAFTDDEVTGDVFDTVGSLTTFVDSKRAGRA